jgi:hypothetical protein
VVAVPVTPKIAKAADLLGDISIFQLPFKYVHCYAVIDSRLRAKAEVSSWKDTIQLFDTLKSACVPGLHETLHQAQVLVIQQHLENVSPATYAPSPKVVLPIPKVEFSAAPVTGGSGVAGDVQILKTAVVHAAKPVGLAWHVCEYQKKDGWVSVKAPYNVELKAAWMSLPKGDRKWDALNKAWKIKEEHLPFIVELLNKAYPGKVLEIL